MNSIINEKSDYGYSYFTTGLNLTVKVSSYLEGII
jgi:hypothetical protein